jgi:hypothetical protein
LHISVKTARIQACSPQKVIVLCGVNLFLEGAKDEVNESNLQPTIVGLDLAAGSRRGPVDPSAPQLSSFCFGQPNVKECFI